MDFCRQFNAQWNRPSSEGAVDVSHLRYKAFITTAEIMSKGFRSRWSCSSFHRHTLLVYFSKLERFLLGLIGRSSLLILDFQLQEIPLFGSSKTECFFGHLELHHNCSQAFGLLGLMSVAYVKISF